MDQLSATVKQFLDQGRMFSGYDVTIETRNREKLKLRHQEVRGDIHGIDILRDAIEYGYDNSAGQTVRWKQTQVPMPPHNQWAFVYHPENIDPSGYTPRQSAGSPSATSLPAISAPQSMVANVISLGDGTTTDSGGQQADGSYAPDYRNRLFIPAHVMREAGLKPGDEVCAFADTGSNSLLVMKEDPAINASTVKITTQVVDRCGDLRISSRTLTTASVTGSRYLIEAADKDFGGTPVKIIQIKSK
jgi:bifunctional DNA-binding transcriptional regulator/antitoxin component of YhaV-PrlF toxin-antitoxin module